MSCRAQLLRSGEHTKAHRATSSTVYYVIEGAGTTVIDGTVFNWRQGDVFVVPTWAWHEHRNDNKNAYLFSITDQPAIELLGMYREQALTTNNGRQEVTSTF
jgi:gentisate 1,2-dioxygenase